ncbi:MAG: hypothetical protein A2169_02175 [Deltaproteobacteria bacterium RBG_13_47_9]|nr:MAG: hypothetical protein A2169_02175 [Deltaproteobacteria bacterium RBG_13_47_9]
MEHISLFPEERRWVFRKGDRQGEVIKSSPLPAREIGKNEQKRRVGSPNPAPEVKLLRVEVKAKMEGLGSLQDKGSRAFRNALI